MSHTVSSSKQQEELLLQLSLTLRTVAPRFAGSVTVVMSVLSGATGSQPHQLMNPVPWE
jgi:hypothetical protein